MSGIGRYSTAHTWLMLLYTDFQDAIYLQSFPEPGMASLLPSFKGKTMPWSCLQSHTAGCVCMCECVDSWEVSHNFSPFWLFALVHHKDSLFVRSRESTEGTFSSHELQGPIWPHQHCPRLQSDQRRVSSVGLDIWNPKSFRTSVFPCNAWFPLLCPRQRWTSWSLWFLCSPQA